MKVHTRRGQQKPANCSGNCVARWNLQVKLRDQSETGRDPSPAAAAAASLLVHVDDIFHQQVALQAVHSVTIQNHLMSAGRTAETTTGRHRGAAPRRQVGIGCLHKVRDFIPVVVSSLSVQCGKIGSIHYFYSYKFNKIHKGIVLS